MVNIPSHEDALKNEERANVLKEKINNFLALGEYEKLCDVFRENDTARIAEHNQDIYIFYIIMCILDKEKGEKRYSILQGRDADQLIWIYRKISIYLRRVEFDLPLEYQLEFIKYIISEKINLNFVVGVISCNRVIFEKERVLEKLKILISRVG